MRAVRVVTFLAASAVMLASAGCSTAPPPVSEKAQQAYDAGQTIAPAVAAPVIPIAFSEGTKTVFFGDSWTSGLYMKPVEKGYAFLVTDQLGLESEVLGGNGTGYLNAGAANLGGYGQRIAALPVSDAKLLIIQGSVNDFGRKSSDLGPAFDETIKIARQKFPAAQIVILGPSTAQWPVQPSIYQVNDILSERSANAKLAYISPYADGWINAKNFPAMIDAANGHLTEAGHAYLASKVVEALKARQAK